MSKGNLNPFILDPALPTRLFTSTGIAGDDLPRNFHLDQNYPNPFKSRTTISYSLPVPERVRLSVYNVIGEEVAIIEDRFMPAGEHLVYFKGDQLPSGVYFYRMTAGGHSDSRRMTLTR